MKNKYQQARKFDKVLYNITDEKAKEMMKSFLISRGHKIVSEVEDYYHDLITEKDGVEHYFELELNLSHEFTSEKDFKYPTATFLGRKERLHKKHPFHYVVICPTTGASVVAYSSEIYQDEYKVEVVVNQPHRKGLDCFYRIPKNKVQFFNINEPNEK